VFIDGKDGKGQGKCCGEGNIKDVVKAKRKVRPQVVNIGKERGKGVAKERVKMW